MGFLNFRKRQPASSVDILQIDPSIDGATMLFIAKDNRVVYTHNRIQHLLKTDDDGDQKFEGRVASIIYRGQSDKSVLEVFVGFAEEESYLLFGIKDLLTGRLNGLCQSIHKLLMSRSNLFSSRQQYSTQFVYTFRMYCKGSEFFLVNAQQASAYLIDETSIRRGSGDEIKRIFWK